MIDDSFVIKDDVEEMFDCDRTTLKMTKWQHQWTDRPKWHRPDADWLRKLPNQEVRGGFDRICEAYILGIHDEKATRGGVQEVT